VTNAPQSPLPAETDRVQLTALNNRSQFYATQLWQLPVAYLAGTGFVLARLNGIALVVGLAAAAVVGALLLWHMQGLEDGRRRAVREIQDVEHRLGLSVTAQDRPRYTVPLYILVALAIIGFSVAGFLLAISS
jgi:hypothetical protein